MCIRYVGVDPNDARKAERLRQLSIDFDHALSVKELFPGGDGTFGKREDDGSMKLVAGRWGLTPFWAKAPNFGKRNAYNARSETIREKPTFRTAFKKRRCVVPASAFYERADGRWLRILPQQDSLFLFAGIWEEGNEHTGGVETYTFATTEPNEVVANAHDRMPVILAPEDVAMWTSLEAPDEGLDALMVPCPAEWVAIEDAGPVLVGKRKPKVDDEPTLL